MTFTAVFADESGAPRTVPTAVALYERDGGVAWKHGDEARRARDLVLRYSSQAGNYDYGFNWIFHQDGTLQMQVELTGIMSVKGVADGGHDPYGHLVAKNLDAVHHQHFFCFRLDMDVDGETNRVVEMNSAAVAAGPRNPYGGAFTMEETPLATERQAQRRLDLATSRRWKDQQTGEWKEETDWSNVVLWRSENLANYLTKGKQIYVEGRLQTRSYEDKDGKKVYATEVVADDVILLGGQGGGGGRSGGDEYSQQPVSQPRGASTRSSAQPSSQSAPQPDDHFGQGITDDDVPF